jgi:alanine dehydrogenase
LSEDLSDCDVILGVKEVAIESLLEGKTYLFFSHTVKEQAYNRELLRAVLAKNIRLIDYELLKDHHGNRLIGFGYYAGLVGAYNGLRAFGLKTGSYQLPAAHTLRDLDELFAQRTEVKGARFLLTGGGRVANGAVEVLERFGLQSVSPHEFVNLDFGQDSVYAQLRSSQIYQRKDGAAFGKDFYQDPSAYRSVFETYLPYANGLIAAAYWDPRAPKLFQNPHNLKVIADITCDINGSIPTTVQSSTIEEPFYDVEPATFQIRPAFSPNCLTVMAVDNLPSELPRDASQGFGEVLLKDVLPEFFTDQSHLLQAATIAEKGNLMPNFQYLSRYAGLVNC